MMERERQLNDSLVNGAGAADVGSCSPQGDSPFGVADMGGLVWQFTTSFVDEHDRNVLTRGSSNYRAGIKGVAGSHWCGCPPPAARAGNSVQSN